MVSIKDVAQKARVSKSTVSLVINNTGYVSAETRVKVEKAMKDLNYVPNQLAKNLSNRNSHLIGVVIPDIVHPFFSTFVKHIEQTLYEYGYMTMVCSTLGREQVELEYLNWLNNYTMDGIVVGIHTLDVKEYTKTKRPIVSLDRYLSDNIPVVFSNHEQAAKIAVQELRKNKCHKVVQVLGSSKANIMAERFSKECKKIFSESGENMYSFTMPKNTFSLDEYFNVAKDVLKQYPNVDAFVGSDMLMTQILKIVLAKGIEVPQTLKLIAYDGTQVTQMGPMTISAVVQPIDLLAKNATELLVGKIEGRKIANFESPIAVHWQQGETTRTFK